MPTISFPQWAVIAINKVLSYEHPLSRCMLFLIHKSDDSLWLGHLEAIKERGADNVYVVLVSYGTGIKVYKDEKYAL